MKYFLPPLALLFIALKLTGYITWSWWLVLLPLYGSVLIVVAVLLVVSVFVMVFK